MNVVAFPMATMSHVAGVWTVTVVTLHRYIAVCMPHHVNKYANLRLARYQASRSLVMHRQSRTGPAGLLTVNVCRVIYPPS